MTPAPIADAPKTGIWILGYIPRLADLGFVGWLAISWGDQGWIDDDGDKVEPSLWSPMPDPQPKPTGWRQAEGVIHIEEITGEGWTANGKPIVVPYRWATYILRNDGSYDDYRETFHHATYAVAEAKAAAWQEQFKLPIEVKFLDPKVTPFPRVQLQ